ncbi:hypothetical protein JI739_20790 [Ramlibacter sp. AW1]|uniref:DUF4398 domain-containing protein n=1 Tax=Ramlibacter aurantiacus TaxID=2801330 RepID=A0A936ZSE8_9BURK|nr:hypothetical protein [Ramlibacter aurantiacus]MBL0422785.1 hypothetical protein [Ramlibacter aurantiacus]
MTARATSARPRRLPAVLLAVLVASCASGKPPTAAWQMDASSALERFRQAYLTGADRWAAAEFRQAREALASTGDATQVARAELTRCALQVAALQFDPCAGFEPLRADAGAPEQAYATYLTGAPLGPQAGLLPPQHRAAASSATPAIQDIQDPLARLVAAGVAVRGGRAGPEVVRAAVDTASERGWRRPLLAWLGLQARQADLAGDEQLAQQVRRRIDLVSGSAKPR